MESVAGWLMQRRGLAILVMAFGLIACGGVPAPPPSPPSEDSALAHLQAVIGMVASGDVESICSVGVSTCDQMLRRADPRTVPSTPPVVQGTQVLSPSLASGTAWSSGGRIIRLCGTDGLGQPYYSEMLVFEDQGRILSVNTPYWLGYTIGETSTTGEANPAGACPRTRSSG